MIESLSIESLGVIERAHVDVGAGFTVVTGETGAGKTMFVSALNLLTGARAETHMVRAGATRAVVEGIFSLDGVDQVAARVEDAGGSIENAEVVVTRTVPSTGRARATAGGRTVPAAVLTDIGEHLVSMHGQTEQLTLKSPTKQRELLDSFGGPPVAKASATYRQAFNEWRHLCERAEHLHASATERAHRIEYLETALARIDEVRPGPGEDEQLRALALKLEAADDVKHAVQTACDMLITDDYTDVPTVTDLLNQATELIRKAAHHDPELDTHIGAVQGMVSQTSELAGNLSTYLAGYADLDDMSLEDTNNRRAALAGLGDYGETVDEVLEFERAAGAELIGLTKDSGELDGIDAAVEEAEARMREAAGVLTRAREVAAEEFARAVTVELTALAMPKATVGFVIQPAEPSPTGVDSIRMVFAAHAGSQAGDIGKLASGGELSRVMLAIEVVKAHQTTFPTFVFDEVDAGVGGRAATEIGRRLARLAVSSQVIVVTHLAQVAAWADTHVVIQKDDSGESSAVSGVEVVTGQDRVAELARMLGGVSDSDSARAHANELISTATSEKQSFPGQP